MWFQDTRYKYWGYPTTLVGLFFSPSNIVMLSTAYSAINSFAHFVQSSHSTLVIGHARTLGVVRPYINAL